MRIGLSILSLLAVVLLGGCAASQAHDTSDILSDPAWTPPGQGDLEVADAPEAAPKATRPRTPRKLAEPNRREKGSLRVADGAH